MTIAAGERYLIPKGTRVYDHVRKTFSTRGTSYPVHVASVSSQRVFWFGDCGRLMSCDKRDVDLGSAAGRLSPRRGRSG